MVLAAADLDLYGDEAQYWSWSRDLAFGYYSKPPLLAWIIRGFTELCGNGEACIRAASPLFHGGTALVLYALGRRLYDDGVGLWSAIVYATLPAVWFSSALISTDVPLLFLWAIALFAFHRALEERTYAWALVTGAAIGFGLLAKYAMIYFLLGALVYAVVVPATWRFLASRQALAMYGAALLLVAPNIVWNLETGLATFAHTADNANWGGSLFHPAELLEFVGAQFGVFGPLLFLALLAGVALRWWRREGAATQARSNDLYLLSFSLPVLLLVSGQALLSRAHANWAAVAYVAATVLVVAWLCRRRRSSMLFASVGLHTLAGVYLYAIALGVSVPGAEPLRARPEGWREIGAHVAAAAAREPYTAIAALDRMVTAELLYYARPRDLPVKRWPANGAPGDHYQLTAALDAAHGARVLLVSEWEIPPAYRRRFDEVELLEVFSVWTGGGAPRRIFLYRAEGFEDG